MNSALATYRPGSEEIIIIAVVLGVVLVGSLFWLLIQSAVKAGTRDRRRR